MTALPAQLWLAIAIVAGLVAAVVTNVPMFGLSDGYTPAVVLTSVIQQTTPSQVSRRAAVAVHHAVGPFAGLLYAGFGIALDAVLPAGSRIGGLPVVAHLVAVVLVTAFSYAVFAVVVLPRYGGAARDRLGTVRWHWLASTAVFGASLAVVVPAIVTAVR